MASGIATTGALPPTGSIQDPPAGSIGQPAAASPSASRSTGSDGLAALSTPPPADPKSDMVNHEEVPTSLVADHDYPNVPDTVPGQAAGTDPNAGGELAHPDRLSGTGQDADKVPFKEQVNGYAKKIAGTVFGNKKEKEFGEAKLQGDA